MRTANIQRRYWTNKTSQTNNTALLGNSRLGLVEWISNDNRPNNRLIWKRNFIAQKSRIRECCLCTAAYLAKTLFKQMHVRLSTEQRSFCSFSVSKSINCSCLICHLSFITFWILYRRTTARANKLLRFAERNRRQHDKIWYARRAVLNLVYRWNRITQWIATMQPDTFNKFAFAAISFHQFSEALNGCQEREQNTWTVNNAILRWKIFQQLFL